MHPINLLFSLTSLDVILVTLERFSFTTSVFLPPHDFIRLHEAFQMIFLILGTVLIPFLLLRYVSAEFKLLSGRRGLILSLVFITGIYFYATGNGVHEIASFAYNTYCNIKNVEAGMCTSMFINDYYLGNGLYFLGAIMMNIVLLILERGNPDKTFKRKDLLILMINSVIYSLAIFAYAAVDRVLVGLLYSIVMTIIVLYFFLINRKKYVWMPITTSLTISYVLGTAASLIVRLR